MEQRREIDKRGGMMAIPVMVIGESGSGKSRSLKNFKKGEISVFNVSKKMFPFRAEFAHLETDDYAAIVKGLKSTQSPSIAIDDATYLMTNEFMRHATEKGFEKFTNMASNFWNLIQFVINQLPNDKIVYFLGHVESDMNGKEKFKTIGKLLDEKITLEGLFTIVLKTSVKDGVYSFVTQTNGNDTVKSPEGMFPSLLIENDLKKVDESIRNFYGIENHK